MLIAVYLAAPLAAGGLGWGDRRGPQIYPAVHHEIAYPIGWEVLGRREGKPRASVHPPPRPWIYEHGGRGRSGGPSG